MVVNWLFNVTINDISVVYVTAHRRAGGLKKLDLWSESPRHRHFIEVFNVPVQAPTRNQPFIRLFRGFGWVNWCLMSYATIFQSYM